MPVQITSRRATPDDAEVLSAHPHPRHRETELSIPPEARDRYGSFRPSDEVFAAWEHTREIAMALAAPIVVFQCPASFTPIPAHVTNLRAFFKRAAQSEPCEGREPLRGYRICRCLV